jgi:hypothetical protein
VRTGEAQQCSIQPVRRFGRSPILGRPTGILLGQDDVAEERRTSPAIADSVSAFEASTIVETRTWMTGPTGRESQERLEAKSDGLVPTWRRQHGIGVTGELVGRLIKDCEFLRRNLTQRDLGNSRTRLRSTFRG